MSEHLNAELSAEIRAVASQLPRYNNGPGAAYTRSKIAYTASITLLHTPGGEQVHPASELLLVQRGEGDWHRGSWGNVSGYVHITSDPEGGLPDEQFDPVAFTARTELAEECGLAGDVLDAIDLRLGERFTVPRFGTGVLHVLPILAMYHGEQRPLVKVDGIELIDHEWTRLHQVVNGGNLSPGYMTHTLSGALGVLGLHLADFRIP